MIEKKKRIKIPKESKVRAELQQEINSICPFCENSDVGHFEIHHIDENPSNNFPINLLLLCCNCHSRITKGDISPIEVLEMKIKIVSSKQIPNVPLVEIRELALKARYSDDFETDINQLIEKHRVDDLPF